ncbi:MAG: cation diffusion facilitator family transporter [Candidatus Nanopelagicales bacterium]
MTPYAWLSIATGVVVFGLKLIAWQLTDSVGLLSDALESTVNIVAGVVALVALRTAAKPGDSKHHFGHGKAEYFSSLVEGLMILLASGLILFAAVGRLLDPRPLDDIGVGLAISIGASIINAVIAGILLRAGRAHRSIVLIADAKHLLTDVWTSIGVVVAVFAVAITGIAALDPLIAILVAINIVVAGAKLIGQSAAGLMDGALPPEENETILAVLARHQSDQVHFHALQTRESGRARFVSMHVLVPGSWTVSRGHDLVEEIEQEIRAELPGTTVQTHMEPMEDPRAWADQPAGGIPVPEALPDNPDQPEEPSPDSPA